MYSGAPRRSTCPSYLMKRPLPMNLVDGSRLAPWQRNASLTGFSLPRPSLPITSVRLPIPIPHLFLKKAPETDTPTGPWSFILSIELPQILINLFHIILSNISHSILWTSAVHSIKCHLIDHFKELVFINPKLSQCRCF